MDEVKRTDISQLGEFGLIDRIASRFKLNRKESLTGIGDDAAVLDYGGTPVIVTTDLLIEGIHFDLMYHPLKHLGYKAVIANLSDICAMNAIPKHITVSIAISNRFSVEAIEELYSGIGMACNAYEVDLLISDPLMKKLRLNGSFQVKALGEKELKGKGERVGLYTLLPAE